MDENTKARYLGDIEYFSAKLDQDTGSVLFVPLALAYINLEKYNDALNVLLRGIDANPDMTISKTLLARAYRGLGQNEDAKSVLTEIRVIDPENYMAEKLLGDIYLEEKNIKKAIISYKNALAVSPEDAELQSRIQNLKEESGLDDVDLLDDRPAEINDEEMLNSLGQELMDEVRQEVGEAAPEDMSEEAVKKTVDEIVGAGQQEAIENFSDDYGAEEDDGGMEEESLASVDDEIVPTDSLDAVKDAIASEESAKPAEEEPEDAPAVDISGMAEELSSDFGLEGIAGNGTEPEPEPELRQEKPEPEPEPGPETAEEPATEADEPAAPEPEHEEEKKPEKIKTPSPVFDDLFDLEGAVESEEMLADVTEPVTVQPVSEPEDVAGLADTPEQAVSETQTQEPEGETAEAEEAAEEAVHPEPEPESEPEMDIEPEPEMISESAAVAEPEPVAEQATDEPEPVPDETEHAEQEDMPEDVQEEQPDEQSEAESSETEEAAQAEDEKTAAEIADEIIAHNSFGVPVIDVQAEEKDSSAEEAVNEQNAGPEPEEIINGQESEITDEKEEPEPEQATDETERELEPEPIQASEEQANEKQPTESESVEPDMIINTPEEAEVLPVEETAKEIREELDRDEKVNDELSILFAIDELEEKKSAAVQEPEPEPDMPEFDINSLDRSTKEHVLRLEDLLETIKSGRK